jgi:predicted MFS family arabinose efflux permease
MVTGGLILLIFALTTAPQAGWRSPATLAAAAAGAAALVLLGAWERRHAAPLIPPSVVGRARVLAPNLAIALQSMVGVSWLFLLTLFFQDVRGLDALTSGLMFAPMTAASVAGAVSAGWVVARLGASRAAAIGIALVVGGLVAMAAATAGRPASMIAGTVVGEAGFMLAGVALTIAATNAFRTSDAGLAAGILNTATQLGGGIGLGVIAAVVSAASSQAQITAGAVRLGLLGCITFSFVALVLVLGGMRRAEHPSRDRTPEPRHQTVPDVDG